MLLNVVDVLINIFGTEKDSKKMSRMELTEYNMLALLGLELIYPVPIVSFTEVDVYLTDKGKRFRRTFLK